jgi:L-fuconolactonase
MRLDAHQHFWKYSAAEYGWIPEGSALQRDWLPTDLAPLLSEAGLDGCIAVQARQNLAESRWLLDLADASEIVKGVVGWVDLRSPNVDEELAEFSAHPKFCGVRHVVQDEPDDRFLVGSDFVRGISRLQTFGLTYDLLIFPRQLPAAIDLVARFPEQAFVLDHLAKPGIKERSFSSWREQIRELARAGKVMCKISGMVTEADHAGWKPDDFRPYLDVVWEAFGEDRLMFGSDWPVCLLAASYQQVFALVADYVAPLSDHQRAGIFGGNAARFYFGKMV